MVSISNKTDKKTEKIEIRVTKYEKDFIKRKALELGYNSMSAFLIDSAKDFFKVDLDLTYFRELSKEINYIGKNINNLVHYIFTHKVYTDYDLEQIQDYQREIKNKLNKEYDHLLRLRRKYTSTNLSLKDKEKLIKELTKANIKVPKELLLKEVYEMIRNNILYICNAIEKSPEQEEGLSDYVYEYIYEDFLYELDQDELVDFSDEIFLLAEKLKAKFINVNNCFEDSDWWELKNILDKYEKY